MNELKLSEEKFFNVFDHGSVCMAISVERTGTFVDVNRMFVETLGCSSKDVIGKTPDDINFFLDKNHLKGIRQILEKDGAVSNYEAPVCCKSGNELICQISVYRFNVRSNGYFLITAIDITRSKKAEAKIVKLYGREKLLADISQLLNRETDLVHVLNEVLQVIGDHTHVNGILIYEGTVSDEKSAIKTYEWKNPGMNQILYNFNKIYDDIQPWFEKTLSEEGFIFSENVSEMPENISQILERYDIRSVLAYPFIVENSFYGFIGFFVQGREKSWSSGELDMLRTVTNIISCAYERRDVLRRLEKSELKLKLAIESANEGVWDWNMKTGKISFSTQWYNMLELNIAKLEPDISSWVKLIHPDDLPYVKKDIKKYIDGETEICETEYRIKTGNSGWKWIFDHGMIVERDEDNNPIRMVGTHIDISKQKETEKELKELIETKNRLFSIISHELRGPVGNFIPTLDIVINGNDLDSAVKNELLEELYRSSKTTFNLLENLLNWSKSQTGSISFIPSEINMRYIIGKNIESLSSFWKQKELTVTNKADNDCIAYADADSLNLVIRNLLNNSIKFTPNYGEIILSADENAEGMIEVIVSDNGVGMSKETAENIFRSNIFHTTYGTNMEKGSGLGLSICKDFVEKNGGKIWAESVKGSGSRFIFTVPKANKV